MKRFYKFLLPLVAIAAMATPRSVQAQMLDEYTLGVDTVTFSSIVSTGTQLTFSSTDDGYATATLPFAFPFGESVFPSGTSIALSANGFIYLGATSTSGTTGAYSGTYHSINALLQADGHMARNTGAGAYTYYDADSGTFTIEYHLLGAYSSPYGAYSYQVVLHNNGDIEMIYDSVFHSTATSRNLATYLVNTATDRVFVTGSWATPSLSTTYGTRPLSPVPAHGLRYSFTRPIITCFRVFNLAVTELSNNSATIAWDDAFNSDATYTIINLDDSTVIASSVTDTFYTFTDLTSDSIYNIGVYADCGSDDLSTISSIAVHTMCAPFSTLPLVFDFEGESTGSSTSAAFASCLVRLNNGSQYFGYPYVGGATYNHTEGGNRGLNWYNSVTTGTYGDYQYVVLPAVDTDSLTFADMQLRFWAKAPATSYYPVFEVGVMTSSLDPTTFELVQTINVGNSTEWDEYVAPFADYTGDGTYIAIRALRPASGWYAYVDDITVENIPACPPTVHLTAATTTAGAAILTWEPQGVAPSGYDYSYNEAGDSVNVVTGSTTEPTLTIVGLQPGTDYEFSVNANCGTDGTGTAATITFSTGAMACLEIDTTTSDSVAFSHSTSGISGCLAYSSYGNTAYQALYTAAELNAAGIAAGGIVGIDLGFNPSSSYSKEFTIFIGSTTTSSISNAVIEIPANNMQVYGPSAHPAGTSGWQHYDFDSVFVWDGVSNIIITTFMNQPTGVSQSSSTGLSGYYVSAANKARFRYRDSQQWTLSNLTQGYAGSNYSYRAAIHFYMAGCLTPSTCAAPVVTNTVYTATTATIEWLPGASETSWDVEYRTADTNAWTIAATAVTDLSYTIENLQPSTDYVIRIVNNCSSETYVATVQVTTPCLPESIPFVEDFESYTSGTGAAFSNCWNKVSTYNSSYPYVTTNYAHSGTKSMYFYGYSATSATWLVLPVMSDPVRNLELRFWEYKTSSSYGTLEVGIITDPNNLATFVPVQTVTPSTVSVWENMIVNFSNYTGSEGRIAIVDRTSSGYYCYVDDVEVNRYSSCPRPQSLHAVHVTDASAILSWLPADSVASYTVKWGTSNDMASAIDSAEVSEGTTYTLTGLADNTTYYAWVSTECDSDYSAYVRCSFTTAASCGTVQNLTVSGVTYSKATVAWEAPEFGTATGYNVIVTSDTATVLSTTTTNTYLFLDNLDSATTYLVSVAANCGSDSSLAVSSSFTTGVYGLIGLNEGTYYIPTYPFYNYSISEQLWLDTELGVYGDTINGIYFNAASAISNRPMKIWVANTALTDLSTSSYVPASNMTLVMDSTYSITTGWNYFPFDAPFVRTAGSNLVVMVHDAASYESFGGWYAASSPVNSLYGYNDGSDYDTNDCSGLSVAAVRAQMRLDATLQAVTCVAPQLAVAGTTSSSVSLVWRAGMNETSWSLDYHLLGDTTWTTAYATTSDTTATVGSLNAGSTYIFRIGALCTGQTLYTTVNATTGCGTPTLPLYEDFDNYSGTLLDIPCWYEGTTNATISATTYPYVSNLIGEGPMLRLYQGAYIALPEFVEPLNTLQVRFKYLAAYNNVPMLFGYMSDPEDLNTFVLIDTLYISTNNEARYFTIPLDTLDADAEGHIAFYTPMPPVNYTFIDELTVELIPTCAAPDSLTLDSATATTATLQWVSTTDMSTSFTVLYRPYGTTAFDTLTTTGTSITITGLTQGTNYEAAVFASCSSLESVSNNSPIYRFATACDVNTTLPYTDNFEGYPTPAAYETGVLPNCWTVVTTLAATAAQQPQLYYGSTYAASGNYSLRMYYTSTLAMPELSTSLDSLQVSFNDYVSSTDYAIVVGAVDSLTPTATFHPADTIRFSTTGQHSETVYLTSAGITSGYIAFRNIYVGNYSYSYSYNYLDNVNVDMAPSCIPPLHLSTTGNTGSTIDLAWTDVRPATEWQVSYATAPLADPSTGTLLTATSNPFTVTGLGDSNYYFYVRTVCGAGDTSLWSAVLNAHPGTWVMRPNMTDTVYLCGGVIYDDGGPNGNYSNSQDSYVIVMPSDSVSLVAITGTVNTEACCDRLVIYDGIGTGGAQLFYGYGNVDVVSTSGPLTLYFHTDGSVNSYDGLDLSVRCESNACPISNISIADNAYNTTSVGLTWNGSSSYYEVEYGNANFTQGTGTTLTTTSNSITLTGLSALTSYDVYIRGYCDPDTSRWFHFNFMTPMCDNVTVVENWDTSMTSATSSYSPIGYSFYNFGYVQTIVDSADMAAVGGDITAFAFKPNSTTAGSYFTNMDVYMANVSESDLTAGFILPDSTHQFVQVIHTADFSYADTAWQLHGFDTAFTWDGHSNVLFAVNRQHGVYSSGSSFVAHTHSASKTRYVYNDNSAYSINTVTVTSGTASATVGDIRLYSCGAACQAPIVSSVLHDYESATITVAGSGNNFELEYGTSLVDLGNTMNSATGVFNISGLTPATTYFFQVRQECDSSMVSGWTEGYFTTDSLPCMEVTDLTVTGTSYNSVSLGWTAGSDENAWEVMVYSTVDTVSAITQTATATVTGLVPQRTYNAIVRPLCGSNANIEGPWCEPVQFTTDACQPVSNVTVSDITGTTATIGWTAPEGATNFRVAYGYDNFSVGDELGIFNVTSNPYVLTDLEKNTAYTVQVAVVCTESLVSSYVGADFTTTQEGIDAAGNGTLSLYPNPASTTVTLRVGEQMVGATMSIVDINGRVVKSDVLNATAMTIDLGDLAKGAYFVRITGEQSTVVRKLIVK